MSFKKIISIMLLTLLVYPIVLAEDVKVEGIATQDFSLIGGSGWEVDIDNVIIGPPTLAGTTVSVGMATVSPIIPRGTIDPNIAVGDRVEAFGELDVGLIKLYGSSDYYIKKNSGDQILSPPSEKSETSANGASQLDSCVAGWQDAPDINLGEVYTSNFCPFSGGQMFKQIYRRFYVPNAGQITAKVMKVPSNGIIMIWLQEVDDQSTLVSSPNIFDSQGMLINQLTGQTGDLQRRCRQAGLLVDHDSVRYLRRAARLGVLLCRVPGVRLEWQMESGLQPQQPEDPDGPAAIW